jgi:hypothetical protein
MGSRQGELTVRSGEEVDEREGKEIRRKVRRR